MELSAAYWLILGRKLGVAKGEALIPFLPMQMAQEVFESRIIWVGEVIHTLMKTYLTQPFVVNLCVMHDESATCISDPRTEHTGGLNETLV